jgi:hypothetical protein
MIKASDGALGLSNLDGDRLGHTAATGTTENQTSAPHPSRPPRTPSSSHQRAHLDWACPDITPNYRTADTRPQGLASHLTRTGGHQRIPDLDPGLAVQSRRERRPALLRSGS